MYGFSNNKYQHALILSKQPFLTYLHGNVGNLNAQQPALLSLIHYWFQEFIQNNGERDPVSHNIHIPSYISKELLYELFKTDQSTLHILPSLHHFLEYIKSHFPHVIFLKQTRLGRCTFCMDINHKKHQVI